MDVTLLKTTKMGQKDLRLMSNLAVMTMLLCHTRNMYCFLLSCNDHPLIIRLCSELLLSVLTDKTDKTLLKEGSVQCNTVHNSKLIRLKVTEK